MLIVCAARLRLSFQVHSTYSLPQHLELASRVLTKNDWSMSNIVQRSD